MPARSHRFTCPQCRYPASKVICTYNLADGRLVRRRACLECDHRWYSLQEPEYLIQPREIEWSRPPGAPASTIVDVYRND